jgi:DNA-binding CsgD family transcriptional regulator
MRTESGGQSWAFLAGAIETARQASIRSLGPSPFESEREAGRGMNAAAALRVFLGRGAGSEVAAAKHGGSGPLAGREAEVAGLVAEGLSNKEIAARLLISPHTVDSHIRGIMNKLGCNSRAQIAAWVASAGP